MSRLLTLQDGKGGFEFAGNAFKITGAVADIDDLKKVLTSNRISFILFCGTFFRREMTNVKQSVRIYNMCYAVPSLTLSRRQTK